MIKIGKYTFNSHLFLGTGKFASNQVMQEAILASKSELVTVALKRVDLKEKQDNFFQAIKATKVKIMPNTSGARNAKEAVLAAKLAREALETDIIKLEIHPDPKFLLPDPIETFNAASELVKENFCVLPYVNADPVLCKRLEDIGVAAVMPLGSPIGSNQGLKTKQMLEIIIEQSNLPVIVDAGLGFPSQACESIEMGASAVLVNTAIAVSANPVKTAQAFKLAVEAGLLAQKKQTFNLSFAANASSPFTNFTS